MIAANAALAAHVSLNGASQAVQPGLADTVGQRCPAALSMTMHVDLDPVDLAAVLLLHLCEYAGQVTDLTTDADALRVAADRLANHGLGLDVLEYRDAIHLKATNVCEPRCASLPGGEHDEDCLAGWCMDRAAGLLAAVPGPRCDALGPRFDGTALDADLSGQAVAR